MKGLSFSEPMVKAWMSGRKTVTRRLMNPQPESVEWWLHGKRTAPGIGSYLCRDENGAGWSSCGKFKPRYLPGETVYIKETWRVGAWDENGGLVAIDYKADRFVATRKEYIQIPDAKTFEKLWIESTEDARRAGMKTDCDGQYHWTPGQGPTRWRSPLFMPEWAARSHALIVSVRPERVREITESEAILEGFFFAGHGDDWMRHDGFRATWDRLHPGSWGRNDWVWRIELEKK